MSEKELQKVYIATFFGTENYGTNLQAIGLSRTIEKRGYAVYMLGSFRVYSYLLRHPLLLFSRLINKLNKRKKRAFFSPHPYQKSQERIIRNEAFNAKYFRSESIKKAKQWHEIIDSKSIFVAGSDILWNPALGYPAKYFLDVAYYVDLPRFSYGSSIGALELPKQYYNAYRRYLGSMIGIGVREQSVAELLKTIIGKEPCKVVDPTLLLTQKEWEVFADKADLSIGINKEGYILCYFVMEDQRYWDYIRKVKKKTGIQVIVLPMHVLDERQPYDVILDGTPYEFVWLIKNAEYVFTDSFHACVISALFEKEFYLLRRKRESEDAKYDDFLARYHLEDRSLIYESDFIRKPIDYVYTRGKIQRDRAESIAFLDNLLNQCK